MVAYTTKLSSPVKGKIKCIPVYAFIGDERPAGLTSGQLEAIGSVGHSWPATPPDLSPSSPLSLPQPFPYPQPPSALKSENLRPHRMREGELTPFRWLFAILLFCLFRYCFSFVFSLLFSFLFLLYCYRSFLLYKVFFLCYVFVTLLIHFYLNLFL